MTENRIKTLFPLLKLGINNLKHHNMTIQELLGQSETTKSPIQLDMITAKSIPELSYNESGKITGTATCPGIINPFYFFIVKVGETYKLVSFGSIMRRSQRYASKQLTPADLEVPKDIEDLTGGNYTALYELGMKALLSGFIDFSIGKIIRMVAFTTITAQFENKAVEIPISKYIVF